MNWNEFESIIEAANIQSRLYTEDWAELEKAFNKWKEKKDEEIRLNCILTLLK